jgi:exodeoxyribonuclease VII large subunit
MMDDLFGSPPSERPRREPGESPESAIEVSVFAELLKSIVEGSVPPVWVRGEITSFTAHRNGHWYFTLRDRRAQLRCVVWAMDARRMPARPDEGMQVTAFGRLSVYTARTDVQFSVTRLEAEGDGLWRKAFEEARRRLEADGLLAAERKRALPRYPRRIAVVTSPDGAALHDIIAIARRRDPAASIVIVPVTVQGENAPRSIVHALRRVGRWGEADLVILARGGGSREDLRAFNDERVARALAACPLPSISAVGHETDVSLCDLVADVRAATPSAAAETAIPVRAAVEADLARVARRLRSALGYRTERARAELARAGRDLSIRAQRAVELRRAWLSAVGASIDALSPLRTLDRGYAVARGADGSTLSRVADFAIDRDFSLIVRDGAVNARTTGTESRKP